MERSGSLSEQQVLNAITSARLINSGSISFDAGDDLTVEKFSSNISLGEILLSSDSKILLVIDKPQEDTAGALTINLYNQDKVDNTNLRDVFHAKETIEKIIGERIITDFWIPGLFVGSEQSIKIGMSFYADSGAVEVFYKLYRL